MEEAGRRLKQARERLNLRVRDVELASQKIAEKHGNDEFIVLINRIAEIENRGLIPTVYKLYSLCAIYRLKVDEVLEWYGMPIASLPADSLFAPVTNTYLVPFEGNAPGEAFLPLQLDPGIDLRRTTYLSRMIQRWGKLPLMFLDALDLKAHRYAFIGTDDWFMYPILQPGSFVVIDENRRKVVNGTWDHEFERPIYFVEHRGGYCCGWCSVDGDVLIMQPHPSSNDRPLIFSYSSGVDIIGQVTSVAMHLDQGRRRHTRS